MVTIKDCAVMAESVYGFNLCNEVGWTEAHSHHGTHGFAAATYEKNGHFVVAFRGTDEDIDWVENVRMVPVASEENVRRVIPGLLEAYGLGDREELTVMNSIVSQLVSYARAQALIGDEANQVPPHQTPQAEAYLARLGSTPVVVTGHSLGGALAKVVALRHALIGVAFNSPFMGNLEGVPPVSSPQIFNINAVGDPLSSATRSVGNLPTGREFQVQVRQCVASPPREPSVEPYLNPLSCPRGTGRWDSEGNIWGNLYGPLCQIASDTLESVGSVASAPERNFDFWMSQYPDYVYELGNYIAQAANHYHTMPVLLSTVLSDTQRFDNDLS